MTLSSDDIENFRTYFDVADELYDGDIILDDLTDDFVARARKAADTLNLSWPPYLPEAEEFALDHHKELNE